MRNTASATAPAPCTVQASVSLPPCARTSPNRLCSGLKSAPPSPSNDPPGDRQPLHEGLPARAAERHERQRCERDRDGCGDRERAPAPVGDQHHGKQQAELRLVAEQPEADAGEGRVAFEQCERAADQRGGEETILPGGDIPERGRKAEREPAACTCSDNAADNRGVGGKRQQKPRRRRGETGRER